MLAFLKQVAITETMLKIVMKSNSRKAGIPHVIS